MSRFGITPNEYRAMLAEQGGVCFICQKPPRKGRILGVDHDHRTGRIRGLLHAELGACNTRLGWFNDDIEWFRRAYLYLTDPPALDVIGERIVPEMIDVGMARAARWERDLTDPPAARLPGERRRAPNSAPIERGATNE